MVARYASFLLQILLLLLKNWEIPWELKERFGFGVGSSARRALMWLQCQSFDPVMIHRMRSIERMLYHQILSDVTQRDKMEKSMQQEDTVDKEQSIRELVMPWLETELANDIRSGVFPKTNPAESFDKQWANHWGDSLCDE